MNKKQLYKIYKTNKKELNKTKQSNKLKKKTKKFY